MGGQFLTDDNVKEHLFFFFFHQLATSNSQDMHGEVRTCAKYSKYSTHYFRLLSISYELETVITPLLYM